MYSDNFEYDDEPTGTEMSDRAQLTKPEKFSDEQEWRLIIELDSRFRIRNDTLFLDVRELDGIATVRPDV